MNTEITTTDGVETALLEGDLGQLNTEEKLLYLKKTCESLGLNPLTKPFQYIRLNGQLKLYATKDCTEQLRKLHNISIVNLEQNLTDDLFCVTVTAKDASGRVDTDFGVLPIAGLLPQDKANTIKKALTQAKRRVTLSICGLGIFDESEIVSMPEGSVKLIKEEQLPQPHLKVEYISKEAAQEIREFAEQKNVNIKLLQKTLLDYYNIRRAEDIPTTKYQEIKDLIDQMAAGSS